MSHNTQVRRTLAEIGIRLKVIRGHMVDLRGEIDKHRLRLIEFETGETKADEQDFINSRTEILVLDTRMQVQNAQLETFMFCERMLKDE